MIICIPLDDVSEVEIKGEKYQKLIDFLIQKSDSFSFALEEYSNMYISESNYDMFDHFGKNINNIGETIDFACDERPGDEHYFQHCESFISSLRPYILDEFSTTNVYGYITTTVKHVKVVELNEHTISILRKIDSLEAWSRTADNEGYPSDLCFHKNGKLVFSCFGGDAYAEVFSNKKSDFIKLKKLFGKLLIKNLKLS